jgi:glutathione S-transferase
MRSRSPTRTCSSSANWTGHLGIDISSMKNLGAFMERMRARPAVQAAMKAEGLLK